MTAFVSEIVVSGVATWQHRSRRRAFEVSLLLVLSSCGSSSGPLPSHPPVHDGAATDDVDAGTEGGLEDIATPDVSGMDAPFDRSDSLSSISGRVVDGETMRALAGRTVRVHAQSTTTDSEGKFELADAPDVYDVVIVDPDGSSVSVYQGLTRRDCLLSHRTSDSSPANTARTTGSLSGGGVYPLGMTDTIEMAFFSPEAVKGFFLTSGEGPSFGPLTVAWNGAVTTSGQLVALRYQLQSDKIHFTGYAAETITLTSGGAAMTHLALREIAEGRVAGTVDAPIGYQVVKQATYRWPLPDAVLGFAADERDAGDFDFVVPDLSQLRGQLCVRAVDSGNQIWTEACGFEIGATDVKVVLQDAPVLASPPQGSVVTTNTDFTWRRFDNGVHLLSLWSENPTRAAPNVHVYTSVTSVKWPDLTPLGMSFPKNASYSGYVGGLGPFATIDDAVSPDGLGSIAPKEARRSFSHSIDFSTAP
jgi:hypothetical protein